MRGCSVTFRGFRGFRFWFLIIFVWPRPDSNLPNVNISFMDRFVSEAMDGETISHDGSWFGCIKVCSNRKCFRLLFVLLLISHIRFQAFGSSSAEKMDLERQLHWRKVFSSFRVTTKEFSSSLDEKGYSLLKSSLEKGSSSRKGIRHFVWRKEVFVFSIRRKGFSS